MSVLDVSGGCFCCTATEEDFNGDELPVLSFDSFVEVFTSPSPGFSGTLAGGAATAALTRASNAVLGVEGVAGVLLHGVVLNGFATGSMDGRLDGVAGLGFVGDRMYRGVVERE